MHQSIEQLCTMAYFAFDVKGIECVIGGSVYRAKLRRETQNVKRDGALRLSGYSLLMRRFVLGLLVLVAVGCASGGDSRAAKAVMARVGEGVWEAVPKA